MSEILEDVNQSELNFELTTDLLEQLAFTISKIIDCRSKFTVAHSFGVSEVAYKIAKLMDYDEDSCRKIRVAGLLHDIGKIGIGIELLNKPGPLTYEERIQIQEHAYYTNKILYSVKELRDISEWASHHHEDHQGRGYPDNYQDECVTEEMDILAYADIFTALAEERPYRKPLPLKDILEILRNDFENKHGSKVLNCIIEHSLEIYKLCKFAISDGISRFSIYESLERRYEKEVTLDS